MRPIPRGVPVDTTIIRLNQRKKLTRSPLLERPRLDKDEKAVVPKRVTEVGVATRNTDVHMLSRISRPQLFMEIARTVSKRSTCMRLNVGAVVVIDNRIVSIGYNGSAPGEPHCGGNECPGKLHCHETIHAEKNALDYLDGRLLRGHYVDLYTTHSPCELCCNLDRISSVKRLFFETPYRVIDHLSKLPTELYQIMPAGWIIDWRTKDVVDIDR